MGWGKSQVKVFAKEIRRRYPVEAWALLVFDLRRTVVDAYVTGVVLSQHLETVKVEDVRQLCVALHEAMGTTEDRP